MAEEVTLERIYDIVVFGATGFTGQFVVQEIAKTVEEEGDLKWAIAGRNMSKCQKVLAQAAKCTGKELDELPIIIADVNVDQSLLDMARQTKVVLNCVGPYRFYGSQVVRACIEGGAHHLDISGEPGFLEKMQLLYSEKAKEAGIYIIGACGFDSIPSDIGVIYTRDKFDGDLNEVEGYLGIHPGKVGLAGHYATWQSAIHGFAHAKDTTTQRKMLYSSLPPKPQHRMAKRGNIFQSEEVNSWCLPFPGSDRSIVFRTQVYNSQERKERPVQFNAYLRMPSLLYTILTAFVGVIFGVLSSFSFGRTLLETFPRFFSFGAFSHEGPTKEQIAAATFSYTFIGHGYPSKQDDPQKQHEDKPDKKIVTKVVGPEMGYVTTPICLVQSAYTLLATKEEIPQGGGVLTTGAAFAKTNLIERLDKRNIKFSIVTQ